MSIEIIQAIGRLRRSQSRNPDTNLVCDELERLLAAPKQPTVTPSPPAKSCKVCEARKATTRNRVARHRKAKS